MALKVEDFYFGRVKWAPERIQPFQDGLFAFNANVVAGYFLQPCKKTEKNPLTSRKRPEFNTNYCTVLFSREDMYAENEYRDSLERPE